MKMKYSEVVWRTLPAVDLPANIRSRYANSSMAVTGFEVDLYRKLPNGQLQPVKVTISFLPVVTHTTHLENTDRECAPSVLTSPSLA
jgi:hypothetical protein